MVRIDVDVFILRYLSISSGKLVYGHGMGLSYFGGEIIRDLVPERPRETDDLFIMAGSGAVYPAKPLRSIEGSLTLAEACRNDDARARRIPTSREPFLLRLAASLLAQGRERCRVNGAAPAIGTEQLAGG